jgi:hypothetical protein
MAHFWQYTVVSGSDLYGPYNELSLNWLSTKRHVFVSTVRAYTAISAVKMAQTFPQGLPASPVRKPYPNCSDCSASTSYIQGHDQQGGQLITTLTNVSKEGCCRACQTNTKCDCFALDLDFEHCYIIEKCNGIISRPDRMVGFKKPPPPTQGDNSAVLLGYPAFEVQQRDVELNAISFAGCQDAASILLKFSGNTNLPNSGANSLPLVLLDSR